MQEFPAEDGLVQLEGLLELLLLPEFGVVGELVGAVEATHHASVVEVVVVDLKMYILGWVYIYCIYMLFVTCKHWPGA